MWLIILSRVGHAREANLTINHCGLFVYRDRIASLGMRLRDRNNCCLTTAEKLGPAGMRGWVLFFSLILVVRPCEICVLAM